MVKRLVFVLVAVALVAGLLVGCGSSATPTPTAAPTKAAAASATTPAAAATTAPSATKAGEATKAPAATTPTKAAVGGDTLQSALSKASDSLKNFSADIVGTQGTDKFTGSIAVKDKKMSMKMTMSGEEIQIFFDNEKKVLYMYSPKEKTALQMPTDAMGDQAAFAPNDLVNQIGTTYDLTAKPTGTETVDGKSCAVFELKSKDGKQSTKMWVWTEKGFPIKMEVKDDTGKTETAVEYKNLQFGNVSDSMVTLPSDATVQDLGSLMGGTPTPKK